MKRIELTQGQWTVVDDADFEELSKSNWFAVRYKLKSKTLYYAARKRNNRREMMHRLLMDFPEEFVDHHDGNTLNNRRKNLRKATRSQNGQNSEKCRNAGIRKRVGSHTYQVRISSDGVREHVGEASSLTKARQMREAAMQKKHGEFSVNARPNT